MTVAEPVSVSSRQGRLVLLATILASGVAFLDGTVVTVALPAIQDDLGGGVAGLQWVLDGYLLTLGSLVLVGGALGDRLGLRRIFLLGMLVFGIASIACGLAPNVMLLVAARLVQGVGAALLTPTSLAILSATFSQSERARAIGAWSGLAGITTAIGPFLGGWLVDSVSWRWVFLINPPLLVAAALVAVRVLPHQPPRAAGTQRRRAIDLPGASLAVLGLALVVSPLIEVQRLSTWAVVLLVLAGLAVLAAFVLLEDRRADPMLPPGLFTIRSFTVANLVTFVVYGALSALSFLLSLALQRGLGWSALAAGAATFPTSAVLLLLSARVGAVLPRVGARLLLTVGPLVTAVGVVMLAFVDIGDSYLTAVLPGVLVFSLGFVLVVTPVTATALVDVPMDRQGVASGTNNAVARIAGLLVIAALPVAAGLTGSPTRTELMAGYQSAMLIAAALCAAGGVIAALGLTRQSGRVASSD